MISLAIYVYKKGDDLNEGKALKTLIVGPVDSLMDEEDGERDAQTFGEDIFDMIDEFEGDLDILIEVRR